MREQKTLPWSQLERYQVIDEINRGGFGVVYRAYEPSLDRSIALKVLSPELAHQPGFVERLRREAVSAARLRHPHIALLYEFGQFDDTAFLAMEYIDGPSLRQLLEAGPIGPERALAILGQIGSALDYAHRMGIVHRDVKPSNLLIGPGDHAVLIDFGLADMAENPQTTVDTAVLGTPHYMAPEQAAGHAADARSDQYALAAVAYELLAGVPPFHGRRGAAAVVHAHIYEPPAPPTEYRPTLPIGVNAVLLRALAKSPYDRYSSLAAFLADLHAAFAAAPPAQRARTPRPAVRMLVGLVLLVLLAGLGAWQIGVFAPAAPPRSADQLPLPQQVTWAYDTDLAGGPALALVADTLVVGTLDGGLLGLRAETGALRWSKGSEVGFGAPAAAGDQVVVGGADGFVYGLSPGSGGTIWRTHVYGAVRLAPLLDGERLVVASEKGYVYVLQASNGQLIWSRPLDPLTAPPGVGGGRLLAVSGRTLLALDMRNGAVDWQFEAPDPISTRPVVAGDRLVVGTTRGQLYTLGLADGRLQARPYQAAGALLAAPLAAQQTVFLADRSGRLTALSGAGAELWRFEAGAALEATPLLADGKLFVGASSGAFYVLDAASGRLLATLALRGNIDAPTLRLGRLLFVRGARIYALGT